MHTACVRPPPPLALTVAAAFPRGLTVLSAGVWGYPREGAPSEGPLDRGGGARSGARGGGVIPQEAEFQKDGLKS